jgi:dGTPase
LPGGAGYAQHQLLVDRAECPFVLAGFPPRRAERARSVIAKLFAAYHQDTSLLPPAWLAALPTGEPARSRYIADFIAGMTDHYAIARYREIFGKAPRGLIHV